MVAADLFKTIFSQREHEVVILGIPVFKGRNMQAAVYAIEIVVFIFYFAVGRFGKLNNALMAPAGDTYQTFILNIKIQGLFTVNPADDRDRKHKRCHPGNNRV